MENESSNSPAAAAASCPPWVMLNRHGGHRDRDFNVEEAQAAAAACTSTNLQFHVSLLLAAPPASSRFYYGWLDSASSQDDGEGKKVDELRVIAVHIDVFLLMVRSSSKRSRAYGTTTPDVDYFLYETGTTAARPPSLLMLPRCYFPKLYQRNKDEEQRLIMPVARNMIAGETGLLRCGEDELLVAQMELPCQYDDDEPRDRAELCALRVGQEWDLKQAVPILFDDHHQGDVVTRRWQTDTAVPVGDRYLCWVDYLLGFLLCDMAADDAGLQLRHVALPVLPAKEVSYFSNRPYMRCSRNLGGAGTGAVRFVHVEPRCCCGDHGRSSCARGRFLFIVTIWTLSLSMDEPLEWVKVSELDCGDLWALPAYEGLPQVTVEYPFMSSDDDPNEICWFMIREHDRKEWMVEVDTRSKALLSIVPYTRSWMNHVAVKLQC